MNKVYFCKLENVDKTQQLFYYYHLNFSIK